MPLTTSYDDAAPRITISGALDMESSEQLRRAGFDALNAASCRQLVIDLGSVDFLDSTGIGALVALRNAALERAVPLVLLEPTKRVRRVLELTTMDQVFDIRFNTVGR